MSSEEVHLQEDLPISISTRDVGLTQVASIWLGTYRVAEFYTQTKYADRSLQYAKEVVESLFAGLLEQAYRDLGCPRWRGEPGGSH